MIFSDWGLFGLIGLLLAFAYLALEWRARRARPQSAALRWILVDGSNVMHWADQTAPSLTPVKDVLARLMAAGLTPLVVFDATAGHKTMGRYVHDFAMARQLGLPAARVFVVNKGTSADPVILSTARDYGARIVSNDRYRDWAADHPEVTRPGHLIRGGYQNGQLWLELDPR